MLAVEMKQKKFIKYDEKKLEKVRPKDIIILVKQNDIVEYNEDGSKTVRTNYKKVNLTKYVNETAKLVKQDAALEKLEELKKVLSK